ncbi:hypothetical protein CLOM_g9733 [Closterium sp. NIES-68]|nr:hypothetical protein CLOM_g9733 [Closterium sp. NIES-68]
MRGLLPSNETAVALLTLLLSVMTLSARFALVAAAPPSATQMPALLELKTSLDPTGQVLTSWSSEDDCGAWLGVSCDPSTWMVVSISLGSQQPPLIGSIPSSLATLSTLSYIDLSSNNLTGPLPSAIGALSNLQFLQLRQNNFSGGIPSAIGALSKLTGLDLSDNRLTGSIPDVLGGLPSLKNLVLNQNGLSGSIPSSIGALSSLEMLSLELNSLNGSLPDTISSLQNVTKINVQSNRLSGPLFPQVGELTNLMYLTLSNNELSGSIPSQLGALISASDIDISMNRFSGSLPDTLGGLTALLTFLAFYNEFVGAIPPSIGGCRSLVNLKLHANNFSDSIPSTISGLTSLRMLQLSSNSLSGSLPDAISGLKSLTFLDVSQNSLNGSLPSSLGEMTTLKHLDASVNSLSGMLPASISLMQSLQLLDLSYNAFSSSLSTALPYLSSLTTLDLSHNQIRGALLPAIPTMPQLAILKLKSNFLEGSVPSSLAPQLSFLDASSNALVGPLPVSYFRMDNLTYLSFGYNNLTGRLPNFSALTKLRKLDIIRNQFSGPLPSAFAPSIVSLELHDNNFTGSLPPSLSKLVNIQSLDMARNNISGAVPDFPRAVSLVFLSLVNNMIGGPVSLQLRNRAQVELRLAGNPWCREPENQLLAVCSAAISMATMEWTPPEICPGLKCRSKDSQAANTAIYSANGACECSDFLSVTLLLTSAPFSVFTSDIANKLRAELADRLRNYISGAPLLEQSQVWVASAVQASTGQILELRFFTPQGGQWDVAVESNILNQLFLGSKFNLLLGNDFGPYVLITSSTLYGPSDPPPGPPSPPGADSSSSSNSSSSASGEGGGGGLATWVIVVIVVVVLLLLAVIIVLAVLYSRARKTKPPTPPAPLSPKDYSRLSDLSIKVQDHFVKAVSLPVILEATQHFSATQLLGEGGHGSVYRGLAPTGHTWAVKRSKIVNLKGLQLFQNEVDNLSKVSHRNLVKLLAYCDEANEQILVYEFVSNGSLQEHLRPKEGHPRPPLTLEQRVDIAIGSAEGLHYLHSFASPGIIHRDVKSENILLTDTLEPRLADFGLLKSLKEENRDEAVSTRVAGTPGYMDPEYYKTFKVTTKSDVYSFGVVLLELITGKPPAMNKSQISHVSHSQFDNHQLITIAEWAFPLIVSGDLDLVADPRMGPSYSKEALRMMATVALQCIQRSSVDRPDMGDVVRLLSEIRYEVRGKRPATAFLPTGETDYSGAPLVPEGYSGVSDTIEITAPTSIIPGGR